MHHNASRRPRQVHRRPQLQQQQQQQQKQKAQRKRTHPVAGHSQLTCAPGCRDGMRRRADSVNVSQWFALPAGFSALSSHCSTTQKLISLFEIFPLPSFASSPVAEIDELPLRSISQLPFKTHSNTSFAFTCSAVQSLAMLVALTWHSR